MKPSEELRKLQDKIHVYIEPIIASAQVQESEAEFVGEALKHRTEELVSARTVIGNLEQELVNFKRSNELHKSIATSEGEQADEDYAVLQKELAALKEQHEADLREVAEMAVRRAMNRVNHPSQVGKIADIVLCEFRDKKAKVNHDS